MKHFVCLSQGAPKKADQWQDAVCEVTRIVGGLVTAKGGTSPIVDWIDGKCTVPTPNP